MLERVLVWGIVILMVIILVPAGVAIAHRLRRTKVARPPEPPAPRVREPRPQPQPAQLHEPPTEVVSIQALDQASAPQATEMVQWYGMLTAMSGPLEGQRFVITETGHAIGRDQSESTIVVNDSRISKRHVRIVVRHGKVFAIDNGSTNGTFLKKPGGERVTERELKRGDVLVLADNAASFAYHT